MELLIQINSNEIINKKFLLNKSGKISITNLTKDQLIIIINEDINIDSNTYFSIESDNISIDGQNHIITIIGDNYYMGLIDNKSYSNIQIKNIKIKNQNVMIDNNSGWLCRAGYANNALNCIIDNCSVECDIYNDKSDSIINCGGICGPNLALSGHIVISNCLFNGLIGSNIDVDANGEYNSNSGGICGPYAGKPFSNNDKKGKVIIINTNSNILIIGSKSGGICGGYSENIEIYNSNVYGSILNMYDDIAKDFIKKLNKYNVPDIIIDNNGSYSGGFLGYSCKEILISNCSFHGELSANNISGFASLLTNANIINSFSLIDYSIIKPIGNNLSGICSLPKNINIINSYSNITLVSSLEQEPINITNCFSSNGNIYNHYIIIDKVKSNNICITNCYSPYNEYYQITSNDLNNNYYETNRWNSSDANKKLIGTDDTDKTIYYNQNTKYKLISFISEDLDSIINEAKKQQKNKYNCIIL
jgi:hypothetical protein